MKLSLPHMEGRHEIQGLRFWNGDPTVQLIDAEELDANLLALARTLAPGTVKAGRMS